MTEERSPRKKRLTRGWIRAIAWVAGGATFMSGVGVLAAAPKPAESARASAGRNRPVLIVRKITRRVIITEPAAPAPVRYVGAPTSSGGSTGGGGAPPPPPTTTSGGS